MSNSTLYRIIYTVVILILILLSMAILANSMTKPLGRDEQRFCTAGVLTAKGKVVYRDFPYVAHMPYHPLLYALIYKISNTTCYLLTGRIVSSICDILIALCIFAIYRRIFEPLLIEGMLFGLAAVILYVFNPLVDYANGFAWNHDLVILAVILASWLFISTDLKKKPAYLRIALIGALLTFSTFMRITTILVQLVFLFVLLMQFSGSIRQKLIKTLPFTLATFAVAVLPLWIIAQAPRAFFLNLFRIPVLNGKWLHQIAMVHNKVDLILNSIATPGYFVLIVIAVYLCTSFTRQRSRLKIPNALKPLLAPILTSTFIIIAFIPPTMWRQYLAMPIPFLIISFAYPLMYLSKIPRQTGSLGHSKIAPILVGVCVFIAVFSFPDVLNRIPSLLKPKIWVPVRLHEISKDITENTKSPKLSLTLAPLYALEGGCNIYHQLASSPFIYRVANLMTDSELNTVKAIGPNTLEQMLKGSPPSNVILGVEFEFLEAPLFRTAIQPNIRDWQQKTYENGPIVYFRR